MDFTNFSSLLLVLLVPGALTLMAAAGAALSGRTEAERAAPSSALPSRVSMASLAVAAAPDSDPWF